MQVVAGGSMYHMVVDTDDQATRLVELMKADRGGRLTYLPLNRMKPESVQYPTQFGQDAVPLLKYLKYNEQYENIIRHVRPPFPTCSSSSK